MILVVSRLRIKQGCGTEIRTLAKELVETTRQEQGCLMYRLQQDVYDDCEFCFVEEWQDQKALEAHRNAAHFIKWREKSAHMVAERVIKRYDAKEISL